MDKMIKWNNQSEKQFPYIGKAWGIEEPMKKHINWPIGNSFSLYG